MNPPKFITPQFIYYANPSTTILLSILLLAGFALTYFKDARLKQHVKMELVVSILALTFKIELVVSIWNSQSLVQEPDNVASYSLDDTSTPQIILSTWLCFGCVIVWRHWNNYRHLLRFSTIFTPNPLNQKVTIPDDKRTYYTVITIFSAAILNILCLINQWSLATVIFISKFLIGSTIIFPLYFILQLNIKYDFYYINIQYKYVMFGFIFILTWEILCLYIFEDYLSSCWLDTVRIIWVIYVIAMDELFPYYYRLRTQQEFKRIVSQHSLSETWSSFISANEDNYDHFIMFLLDNYVLENLLFMLEVIQYKNKIVRIMHNEIDGDFIGFTVRFENSQHLPTTEIIQRLDRNTSIDDIYVDMEILYYKYINSEEKLLNVLFISHQGISKVKQNLYELTVNNETGDILKVFDVALEEVSSNLQFMYIEYLLQRF